MGDFTSALYLGLRHPSGSLRPWTSLSTGRPAALGAVPRARDVGEWLARLQGCESAILAPSTLHLFWDLFGMMPGAMVFLDEGVYPIARWGAERGRARGVPVIGFPHYDWYSLRRRLEAHYRSGLRPLVVADGFCPGCGRSAPIKEYLECLAPFDGELVIDDTQALGIFGRPHPQMAFGVGGGGTLSRHGVVSERVSVVASLAKAFGVPVAALSGAGETIERFIRCSETRVHASPPSQAVVHAAERALLINRAKGDRLRSKLAERVERFRSALKQRGLGARGGVFPVQTLKGVSGRAAQALHARLRRAGIQAVLHLGRGDAQITFLITARHHLAEIGAVAERVAGELSRLEKKEPQR